MIESLFRTFSSLQSLNLTSPTHRSPLLQRHRRSYSPSHHHSSSSRRLKPRFNSSPPRSPVAVSFPLSSSSRRLRPPCLPVPAVAFGASDSVKQMDLETENRLAAMLMREAAELRRQSEQEGVLAYLRKPNVRTRPNSRFLTATVHGVQQANRAVEVNEMWRVRQKELELDKRAKGTTKDKSSGYKSHRDRDSSRSPGRHGGFDNSSNAFASCSSKREYELDKVDKGGSKDKESVDKHYRDISNRNPSRSTSRHGDFQEPEYDPEPEGLRDEELEEFLHSRTKRGRGAVGPRMDETGPYLSPHPDGQVSPTPDARERRVIYGPERPSSGKSDESSEEEFHDERPKKRRKSHSGNSGKEHTKKRRTKEKSKHKKKEKKRKHRH